MLVEAEIARPGVPVLEVQCRCSSAVIEEVFDVSVATTAVAAPPASPACGQAALGSDASEVDVKVSEMGMRSSDSTLIVPVESLHFVPSIRSGSFANIGPRRYMEDEHICIDDLAAHLGSTLRCPTPSAFYGVFDGHGGPEAAAYIKKHAIRLLFEDATFPEAFEPNKEFLESIEESVRGTFLLADVALADDCTICSSSGTTALMAFLFGRLLVVANVGDCRAVLCRKGEALEMSQDHRPIYAPERQRVEASGGYIDGGYLNGVLSVTRALGDWDMKLPRGSPSPLIAEPEFRQVMLTENDDFLIIGCDGIWDVMSSQHAVSIVSKGLRRHDNLELCARELVMEALRLRTFDNLTVVVVCFTEEYHSSSSTIAVGDGMQSPGFRCCKSLSADALCNLKSWLDKDGHN